MRFFQIDFEFVITLIPQMPPPVIYWNYFRVQLQILIPRKFEKIVTPENQIIMSILWRQFLSLFITEL